MSIMTIPEDSLAAKTAPSAKQQAPSDTDYCLASGLRRKFLEHCDENPGAEECRLYDV
jgi:hypothetical protein